MTIPVATSQRPAILDDSQWSTRVVRPDAPSASEHDVVWFDRRGLRSSVLARLGFATVPCTTGSDGDIVRIEGANETPRGGRVEITGSIASGILQVTCRVSAPDEGAPRRIVFRGERTPRLEATRWRVALTPAAADAGQRLEPCRLLFWNRRFSATGSSMREMPASRYRLDCVDGDWRLTVDEDDGKGNRRAWRLEVDGERMIGDLRWRRGDRTVVVYRVDGRRYPLLDATVWSIEIGEEAGAVRGALRFRRGRVSSSGLATNVRGLPYEVDLDRGRWRIRFTEPNGGRKWTLSLDGLRMAGTVTGLGGIGARPARGMRRS